MAFLESGENHPSPFGMQTSAMLRKLKLTPLDYERLRMLKTAFSGFFADINQSR